MPNNKPLRRDELSKFLSSNKEIKHFENIQYDATAIDIRLDQAESDIDRLENPSVFFVDSNYQITTDYYGIVVTVTGLVVTLPKASLDLLGRIWTITLAVSGDLTVACFSGDSFPAPTNDSETSVLFNQRGMTLDFRCVSADKWVIV